MIKILHTFTPGERRAIAEAQQRLQLVMETIAKINGIDEPCQTIPDGSGLASIDPLGLGQTGPPDWETLKREAAQNGR